MNCQYFVMRILPMAMLVLALTAMTFIACGGKSRFTGMGRPDARTAPKVIQLDQALAELDGLAVPEGVDPALFAQLREALRAALVARGVGKIVCKPPTGSGNAVPDLTLTEAGGGTYDLTWHYYNLGDYDQNGKVGISDITPIAVHFNETVPTGDENALAAVVDGSGNDKVDIADVTPIAVNFGVECAGYYVGAALVEDWSQRAVVGMAAVQMGTGKDSGRMAFTHNLTPVPLNYYWVAPYDAIAVEGTVSNSQRAPGIPGDAPVADIQADHTSGYAPLTVNFDASGSHDPDGGSIVLFEWDANGDSLFETTTGSNPYLQAQYTEDGYFSVRVRVTDDEGGTDTAAINISVGTPPTYDEVEDNDDESQANTLPALPFSNIIGSLGDSPPAYDGYDGDAADFFAFTASEGSSVTFSASFNGSTGNADLVLFDNEGDWLTDGVTVNNPERLWYTFVAGDAAPFYLVVSDFGGGYGDYSLSGVLGLAPTAVLEASPTWGPPPLEVDFDASDSTDDGSIALFEWDLDGDGSFEVSTGTDSSSSATYDTEGIYFPAVRVTDNDGLTHTASVTINASTVAYDEVEDNDAADVTATPLPALPFAGFSGSAGDDPPTYIGYDGDTRDFFSFNASLGDTVTFGLEWSATYMGASLTLYDSDGDYLWGEGSELSPFYVTYTFAPGDAAPFYLEVFCWTGYADYYLRGIEGAPPTADVVATPQYGLIPLTVDFDAGGSGDDDGIVEYAWDFLGEGNFTAGSVAESYEYTDAGWYRAWLRVTDTDGLVDYDSVLITAGDTGYDEIEDNDDIWEEDQSTPLPPIPFYDFTGSVGDSQPEYVGYDGDDTDYFSFDATEGETVTVTIAYDSSTAGLYVDLYDSEGDFLYYAGDTEPLELVYTFVPGHVAPFYLDVYGWYTDYTISIEQGAAPVADLTADRTEGAPPLNVVFDASGSYDPDGGSIVTYEWDWDGDGSWDEFGSDPVVMHSFAADGWYRTTVLVWDDETATDTDVIWIFVPDAQSYYDEDEDNDDFPQANPLPLFNFTGFYGSCGQSLDGDYPGYDGDMWDFLALDGAVGPGNTVSFDLSFDPNGCYMLIVLVDANWNWWAVDEGDSGALSFEYTFTGDETPPYYLEVDCWDGGSDYYLDGTLY